MAATTLIPSKRLPPPRGTGKTRLVKCISYPNRSTKRVWTANAVGRVYCTALSEGVTEPEIQKAIRERCGSKQKKPTPGPQNAQQALAVAEHQLTSSNTFLGNMRGDYDAFEILLNVLIALGLVVAVGRFIRGGLVALRTVVQQRLTQIKIQRDANAQAIQIIQNARASAKAAGEFTEFVITF